MVLFWSGRVNRQQCSDKEVMELEQPTKRLKLSILHAQDCWHFVYKLRSRRLANVFVTSLMPMLYLILKTG